MKNSIYRNLIISDLAIFLLVTCSKTDTTPQTCYMANITNAKGNVLEKLTYDASNRLISDASDSTGLTFDFAYNTQNLVDKITVTDKTATKVLTFGVTFTYDATGKATQAVTTFNGATYQTAVFTYTNTQLTSIKSTANKEVDVLRFEYTGENISKVYQKLDGDKEYLYYEITKFDDKKTYFPAAYQALALGLAGLVDDFRFLNKNNALSEKFYEDGGILLYTADNVYEYNSTLQPTKETQTVVDNGKKFSNVLVFSYNCK